MTKPNIDLLRSTAVILVASLTLLNLTTPSGVVGVAHADPGGDGIAYCECGTCGGSAYCAYQICDYEDERFFHAGNGTCNVEDGGCIYLVWNPEPEFITSWIYCEQYGCVMCWPE